MRFMMIVKGNADSEAGVMPSAEEFQEMTRYNEQLVRAGIMLAGEGLHPTSKGFKVAYDGPSKRTVVDGPFSEAKEVIAGYWIIETKTREEAVEWAKRVPFQEGELEVRQIFGPEDFEGAVPEDVIAKEIELREQIEKRGQG
jgi:hypothetical protein